MAVVSLIGPQPSAWGAATWQNLGADFNTGANWSGGTGPGGVPGTGDVATFDSTGNKNPNLSSSLTILGLNFQSSATGYTVSSGGSSKQLSLTNIGSGLTTSAVNFSNTSGSNVISAPLVLAGAASSTQIIQQAAGGTLTLSGTLSNTNAVTLSFSGGGTIEVKGANTSLTAGLALSGATTLRIGDDAALGTAANPLTVSGTSVNTIQSDGATARTLTTPITHSSSASLTFGSGGDLSFGALTLSGDRTVTVNNSATTFASLGQDVAGRAITKLGTGALIVTGNKANTGTTLVSAGMLAVGGTFNSDNVNLGGGVLGLNGTFSRFIGTGAAQVRLTSSGGFAAYGTNATWGNAANNLIVNLGGSNATLTVGTTTFLPSNSTLILSSTVARGTVDFQNGLDLAAGTRTVQVNRSATAPVGALDAKISRVISNGGLIKTGAGTLSLIAVNTYAGGTAINGGTLLANNTNPLDSATGNGAVTVNSGGRLGGSGYVGRDVSIESGGILSPGATATAPAGSFEVLTNYSGEFPTMTWKAGGTYEWEASASASDKVAIHNLTVGPTDDGLFKIQVITVGSGPANFEWKTIAVSASGALVGWDSHKFDLPPAYAIRAIQGTGSTGALIPDGGASLGSFSIQVQATPEPTTTFTFGAAAASLFLGRWRRRRAGSPTSTEVGTNWVGRALGRTR